MQCRNCYKDSQKMWKVRIVDEFGNRKDEECCSEHCCNELKSKYVAIHQQRINEIEYQNFIRMF